jgi:hypothetical protein
MENDNVLGLYIRTKSRGGSVGIVTAYGLTTGGPEFEFQYNQEFTLFHIVQTGSDVHPASYPMCTGVSSGDKVAET